jgi:prevent-host-death family protein
MKWNRTSKPWQLQEAKAKFSEVFDKAFAEGPQHVTRHGKDEAVLLTLKEYKRLLGTRRKGPSLLQVLRSAPSPLADLDLRRDQDPDRRISDFSE